MHSTINVASGQEPTLPELAELLANDKPWTGPRSIPGNIEFPEAVRATGRRKLVICALWTEVCMAFTALDALREEKRFTPLSTRLPAPHPRLTAPAWTGWSKPRTADQLGLAGLRTAAHSARQERLAVVEIALTDRLLKE